MKGDDGSGFGRIVGLDDCRFSDFSVVTRGIDFEDNLAPPAGRNGADERNDRTASAGGNFFDYQLLVAFVENLEFAFGDRAL